MKNLCAYITVPFKLELREEELRPPGQDEVVVKVGACGICGFDLAQGRYLATKPTAIGHEIAGTIVEKGKRITDFEEGDAVVLESASFCCDCRLCRNGRVDLCNKGPGFWNDRAMGFGQYVIAHKRCVVPTGELSLEEAVLAEPLGVAIDMVRTAQVELDNDMLVVGIGSIGLMGLRLAKLSGVQQMYAAARSHSHARIAAARELGADEIIETDRLRLTDFFREKDGVDRAIVTAPPWVLPEVFRVMNYGGIVSYIGDDYSGSSEVTFNANFFHHRKLRLHASFASPALYFPQAIDLLERRAIDPATIITHKFPLEKIQDAFDVAANDKEHAIKVIVVP